MNVRDIIEKLRSADQSVPVRFDFCGCVPTTVGSWRGSYCEPALGWRPTGYSAPSHALQSPPKYPTVGELIAELTKATSGIEYTGWKGGEYTYTADQELRVDNPGDCTDTIVSNVVDCEHIVVLVTSRDLGDDL